MKKKIQVTEVFNKTLEASKEYRIICHQGGSRSSKTWSILQFFLSEAVQGKNLTITIARDKLTWIKSTILKDLEVITHEMGLPVSPSVNANRAEQIYNVNGTEFAFFGLDYAEKLHGRTQDWFWINEAMEASKKDFDQLEMRTRIGGILDFNPYNDLHWIFDLSRRPDAVFIKSSMLDNPFLEDSIIRTIKGYEPTPENIKAGTADSYMWEVYGLGNKARLQGLVFENWSHVDTIPNDAKFVAYGLDFGYTNDPTVLTAMWLLNGQPYFRELIYETGLTNQDIAVRMRAIGIERTAEIWADSSEPKSIEEIKRQGFNIKGVIKGSDSIQFGIDILKSNPFYITKDSVNADNELRRYKWHEDKAGLITNKPVDAFNHFIDTMRYLAMSKLKSQAVVTIRSRDSLGL